MTWIAVLVASTGSIAARSFLELSRAAQATDDGRPSGVPKAKDPALGHEGGVSVGVQGLRGAEGDLDAYLPRQRAIPALVPKPGRRGPSGQLPRSGLTLKKARLFRNYAFM
jgi:hypothetical protein